MKESNWDECIETNSSIKRSVDKAKAKSLIETAFGRNKFLENNLLNEENASYIFEGYYSSILELLHAIVILDGYKVNNHICLGFYLRDIFERDDLFRIFDDCRYKRNSLIYYGKRMDFDTAKTTINRSINLIEDLKSLIKEKSNT